MVHVFSVIDDHRPWILPREVAAAAAAAAAARHPQDEALTNHQELKGIVYITRRYFLL